MQDGHEPNIVGVYEHQQSRGKNAQQRDEPRQGRIRPGGSTGCAAIVSTRTGGGQMTDQERQRSQTRARTSETEDRGEAADGEASAAYAPSATRNVIPRQTVKRVRGPARPQRRAPRLGSSAPARIDARLWFKLVSDPPFRGHVARTRGVVFDLLPEPAYVDRNGAGVDVVLNPQTRPSSSSRVNTRRGWRARTQQEIELLGRQIALLFRPR